MRFLRLLLFLLPVAILAKIVELQGVYSYPEALRACKEVGENYRIMEIWELFALRGHTKRFGKDKLYWSGNTLGEARIEKNIRHESEIFVNDTNIPAYAFYLQDGDITPTPKEIKAHVLCTNGPKHHQLDRQFHKLPNGMVLDQKSEILWEPFDISRDKKKLTLEKAREYCENLDLAGLEWRLPDIDELFGIVNYNYTKPSVNKAIFGHMHHKYYLSDDEFGQNRIYLVGFAVGSVATGPKSEHYYFRCVADLDEEASKTLGIFLVPSEIRDIIYSKLPDKEKLEKLLQIVQRYELDSNSAKLIKNYLDTIHTKKLQSLKNEILRNIRIRSNAIA